MFISKCIITAVKFLLISQGDSVFLIHILHSSVVPLKSYSIQTMTLRNDKTKQWYVLRCLYNFREVHIHFTQQNQNVLYVIQISKRKAKEIEQESSCSQACVLKLSWYTNYHNLNYSVTFFKSIPINTNRPKPLQLYLLPVHRILSWFLIIRRYEIYTFNNNLF